MSFDAAVHAKAIQLNTLVLDMTAASGSGHPTTAMSLGHMTTVLMYHAMRWSPEQPGLPTADRLVLSAGHGVPIVYAAYADLGGVIEDGEALRPCTLDDLKTLRRADSPLDGHPNPCEGFPFFDAATGSLGQGLSVAAGLGLAARLDGLDRRIYCIIGDGESREGQIWEAVDFLIDHKLCNVLPIFSCNGFGQADTVSAQQSPEVLTKKLEAAGFSVLQIDGHDPAAIRDAFEAFAANSSVLVDNEPPAVGTRAQDRAVAVKHVAIVARTIKGWGAPSVQGHGWHGKPPKGPQLEQAKTELSECRVRLVKGLGAEDMTFAIYPPAEQGPPPAIEGEAPSLTAVMGQYDMGHIISRGSLATRKAYGIALRALGKVNPNIVVLDGDVRNSTFAETFYKDADLKNRFFECKIAEQNMISVAAGLSAAGKTPFCSSFAKFLTRGYDQIEMAINSGSNIKVVGSHAGISLAADGPSQMGLPDIAWFRAFTTMQDHRGNPGCYVLQPADAYAAYGLTMVMAEYEGACYMRTLRPDTEFLYDESTVFNLGGLEVLTEGRDLLIVAAGYMVHEANRALDDLDKAGIDATLVDLYSLPFDSEKLLDLAQENNGMILTLEDNYGASLGSAVADALTEDGGAFTLEQMFVKRIPKSARSADDVMRMCGLDHQAIVQRACQLLQVAEV
ncbi:MAG: transketolase [Planctomycetes bacterium]|nr:transketolase [Planctomycetota bacterium]NOG55681.1 transketolase [Planctomycetota bacterium]